MKVTNGRKKCDMDGGDVSSWRFSKVIAFPWHVRFVG
jgi:hypothetical protein